MGAGCERYSTASSGPSRSHIHVVNGACTRALLDEQNATSLQDALRNVPGIGFSVGDGQRDQISLRGFNNITDQYVDGIRDDALYYRDLSNVERVDVLKGPAAVLYGRGSAGGLINRVLKKPTANPQQAVGVTLGTEGERRGEFDLFLTWHIEGRSRPNAAVAQPDAVLGDFTPFAQSPPH